MDQLPEAEGRTDTFVKQPAHIHSLLFRHKLSFYCYNSIYIFLVIIIISPTSQWLTRSVGRLASNLSQFWWILIWMVNLLWTIGNCELGRFKNYESQDLAFILGMEFVASVINFVFCHIFFKKIICPPGHQNWAIDL